MAGRPRGGSCSFSVDAGPRRSSLVPELGEGEELRLQGAGPRRLEEGAAGKGGTGPQAGGDRHGPGHPQR